MLEFIVLGQVPGTSIQITFKMVLGIATILVGGLLLRSVEKRAIRAIREFEVAPANEPVLQ